MLLKYNWITSGSTNADSLKTVKVREMNRLMDNYEDEDKQMNKVLNKFFKDTYFLLFVFIIPDVYDKDRRG